MSRYEELVKKKAALTAEIDAEMEAERVKEINEDREAMAQAAIRLKAKDGLPKELEEKFTDKNGVFNPRRVLRKLNAVKG